MVITKLENCEEINRRKQFLDRILKQNVHTDTHLDFQLNFSAWPMIVNIRTVKHRENLGILQQLSDSFVDLTRNTNMAKS